MLGHVSNVTDGQTTDNNKMDDGGIEGEIGEGEGKRLDGTQPTDAGGGREQKEEEEEDEGREERGEWRRQTTQDRPSGLYMCTFRLASTHALFIKPGC